MKTYYEMLSLPPQAGAEEIRKAFRREIARYHPDKVQHLGEEFQKMAASMAADLTEAYRILMDPALRETYDGHLHGESGGRAASSPRPPDAAPPSPPDAGPSSGPQPPPVRQTSAAGLAFVKRATLSKIREALADVLGEAEAMPVPGFDVGLTTKPRKGLFRRAEESLCLLVKFVPDVDPQSIAQVWPSAARAGAANGAVCVLMLIGPAMAPARDLAAAVTEQRRRARSAGPVLVPVDVRDWEALFPPETPAPVRALIERLRNEKR